MRLSHAHERELATASGISLDVITERAYRTLDYRDRDELPSLGIHLQSRDAFPCLILPMYRPTGERISTQCKPAKPITIKGRKVKYLSPRAQVNHLDVHPHNHARIADLTVPLWITEGIKKSDALTSRGCCVVAISGVYNWRNKLGTLGDWEDVPMKRREIILCFDADAKTNMNVARAMVRLGRWCQSKGAKKVLYLAVPCDVNGIAVKGADDYFAAGGTLDALLAAATTTEPDTATTDDIFSDSRLAETIADDVFTDRFVWCKALGWLGWTGQRWATVTEEGVGEAVRLYAVQQFTQAAMSGKKAVVAGWQSMLGAARQRAVLGMAKGIVERAADAFDADPDVLNTPSGVVDLRTGTLLPHDPDLLLTKITHGSYRPWLTHPDVSQAFTALPPDVRDWIQVRIGQAITGHPTPDGLIPVAQGAGENGKTLVLTDGILPALGDYAAPASPKLVSGTKDEHSTERADLRGQRFLIAEELTENRALNMTAIKQIVDVGTIKARFVFKDNFSFPASHSLFITTNFLPIVHETDHGTWRRLALVVFPYTFKKPGQPLLAPTDRHGDPGLKQRIRRGADGQHDAIVTWAVEGARRWYAEGTPPLPARVDADTRAWRRQADRVLAFWHDVLIADTSNKVLATELLAAFNFWLKNNGHHEWSRETFHPRFKSHSETANARVEERRTKALDGLSRPSGVPLAPIPPQPVIYAGVRFRALDEIDENIQENADVADLADPNQTFPKKVYRGKVPEGSATPATPTENTLASEVQRVPSSSTPPAPEFVFNPADAFGEPDPAKLGGRPQLAQGAGGHPPLTGPGG